MKLQRGQGRSGPSPNLVCVVADDPKEQKPFQPLQAVQQFAAHVQSQIREKFDKGKPNAEPAKESVTDAVAAATSASGTKPSDSQNQARSLVSSLSSKGFVLARSSQLSESTNAKEVSEAATISKEELGRSTWTMLHTLAVQYPETPTKQQQNDVKTLVNQTGFICSFILVAVHE